MNHCQRTVFSPCGDPLGLTGPRYPTGPMPDARLWLIVVIVLVLTNSSAGGQTLSLCADALAVLGAAATGLGRVRPEPASS
ncbi:MULTISPECIES: hypothetical protein [Streptomyces]|uniref:Uncharacterized protein n=1 Tax=Streptomyces spororaveus TaxID=284039 RepID=A0ABQ3TEQ1_9ACTN|nr:MULTISPECIES: hypothetical protein [Streptomyces]MCM9080788.1 hypothetical protein [Streptomyces spororaveus]MCX5304785.1 hypothetical protein [Streptomyces sp. NBC_00160]GHI78859.1 hypothetical protein Sspor_44200 [Streptomyces spororaveus]